MKTDKKEEISIIDYEKQQRIVYYPNSRIRKVTYTYSGGDPWEDALIEMMIDYLRTNKIIE